MADKEAENRSPRINFLCPEDTKNALKKWARRERRTMSNLIARIVDDAVANEQVRLEGKATAHSPGDPGEIALGFLNKIFSGKYPTNIERASLADSLGIDLSRVDALVNCVVEERE